MTKYLRPLFFICIFVIVGLALACASRESGSKDTQNQSDQTELEQALQTGVSPDREAPFQIRSFHPYINGQWIGNAVAYGCYRAGQAPGRKGPGDSEILEDLQIIDDHWSLIRVYGADDDSRRILQTIRGHELSIRVMLGIWLQNEAESDDQRATNIEQVLRGIELANEYSDIVVAVSVGNETQVFWSGHRMAAEDLIRYIRAVRNAVDVPVTTADDYNFWNKPESKAIAGEIDFVTSHMHPLWNSKTIEDAIPWLDRTYNVVQAMHPDRLIIIGETGWATDYNASKTGPGEQGTLVKGEVSLDAQASFLIALNAWVDSTEVTTFLFEAFDEPWKGGGEDSPPNEIEKHWGVFYESRIPKESFVRFLNHRAVDAD